MAKPHVQCEQHSGCLRFSCGRVCRAASNVQRGKRATKSAMWRVAAQLEDGTLRVFKKVDTRRADELHGLTRYAACARDTPNLHKCPQRKLMPAETCFGRACSHAVSC